jgi:hypothetical protein
MYEKLYCNIVWKIVSIWMNHSILDMQKFLEKLITDSGLSRKMQV